ncbi:hypothetical protein LZ318_21310 [Saccharopolyspora indica]|uniref:hypothetical protein n=1 Tax=Saccharopolyspora indica TaxID=1229659 RepID=UPI0022EAC480|nr:hypothetical protein [Saccharopolyspora indica]MDA3642488.1 hypothetical protein [Saccharopolyspora indica]
MADGPAQVSKIEQSRTTGRRLESFGWFALLMGVLSPTFTSVGPDWLQVAGGVLGLALIGTGLWAVLRGRRHLAPVLPSLRALAPDERIVLFLRSFSDDRGLARTPKLRLRHLLLRQFLVSVNEVRTEEQQIARGVAPFGRMVALGQPGDRLPRTGAERAYTTDEQWQDEILAALDRADLVLLAAGPGRSLEWEVRQVVQRNAPGRLAVVITRDRHQYQEFRSSVGHVFPKGLPEHPPEGVRGKLFRSRYVRALIWFEQDWTPHLELLNGRFPRIDVPARALPRGLRPPSARQPAPRPKVVTACVAAFASFWGCAELAYLIVPLAVMMIGAGPGEVSGLLAITGNPTFDTVFGLTVLTALWVVPFVLWMRRALRGGPVAVLMLQIMSIFTGFVLLVALVWMAFIAVIWMAALSAASRSFAPLAVLLPFQIIVYLAGAIALPVLGFLLLRREVRDWLDSRT